MTLPAEDGYAGSDWPSIRPDVAAVAESEGEDGAPGVVRRVRGTGRLDVRDDLNVGQSAYWDVSRGGSRDASRASAMDQHDLVHGDVGLRMDSIKAYGCLTGCGVGPACG